RAREVERVTLAIDNDLGDVWVVAVRGVVDAPPERAHLERRITGKSKDSLVDGLGLDERFISLQVDDQVIVEPGCNLGNTIGAARMIRRSHPDVAAERAYCATDALVVGRHNHR